MTKKQFENIVQWQNETFPAATSQSKLAHLQDEVLEVLESFKQNDFSKTALEFADCFFLLFGAASKAGMTYEDICFAIRIKLKINKERQWNKPDERNIYKHKL